MWALLVHPFICWFQNINILSLYFLKKEKLACKKITNKRIWNISNIVAYLSVKQKHMQMINANKYSNKP